jgi:hypothetical protein
VLRAPYLATKHSCVSKVKREIKCKYYFGWHHRERWRQLEPKKSDYNLLTVLHERKENKNCANEIKLRRIIQTRSPHKLDCYLNEANFLGVATEALSATHEAIHLNRVILECSKISEFINKFCLSMALL